GAARASAANRASTVLAIIMAPVASFHRTLCDGVVPGTCVASMSAAPRGSTGRQPRCPFRRHGLHRRPIHEVSKRVSKPMARQFIYHMHGMSKAYAGGKKVLDNIHLSFYPDAKIGVLGPNGSGKSTLLKIMAGIDTEFQGEAW